MKAAKLDDRTNPEPIDDRADFARVDGPVKVTGQATYSVDVRLPGQLEAAVLRSPHPRARVVDVDVSAASSMPGVEAVIHGPVKVGADDSALTWYAEETPFFSDTVRFVGDEIAAVAAIDADTAQRAIAAIDVRYEILDHVTDIEEAARQDEWDDDAWDVAEADESQRGDTEWIDDADIVLTGEFRTPVQIHHALEAHACVAQWIDGGLTVHSSTQGINSIREELADTFELDHNRVRVLAPHVGGGFGAKQVPWKNTAIAVLLAQETGRPVRLVLDRIAESIAAGKRGATRQRVKLGATASGELVGLDVDGVVDVGAYSMGGEATSLDGPYLHLYRCPNVRVRQRTVHTNTGPSVAFRAPGYVESTFALESMIDELARTIGTDPIALRRLNYTEVDQEQDLPWSSPQALATCYDRVAEESNWETDAGADSSTSGDGATDSGRIRRGRGFAAHEWAAGGAMPPGYAWIEMNSDGSVSASSSTQDIGTGTRTSLTQVIATELTMDPARIRLSVGDTASGPPAPTSHGSTTAPTMAPALAAAAVELRRQILAAAAEQLDESADDLSLDNGNVVDGDGATTISLPDLMEEISPRILRATGARLTTNDDVSVRPFGAVVADVEVDTGTGRVRVSRLVIAPDCGRILHPMMVESQVVGGAIQGLGFALTEEQVVDHRLGRVINPNLEDYLIPTMADLPDIVHAAVDLPDFAANPLGVKGIGELPMIAVPAAIANAVADAIGRRPTELPLSARRVVELLDDTTDRIEVRR